jgi:Transposase DNA-binding
VVSVLCFFQLPTIWGGFGWLLMDRILPQARYLPWGEEAWRSDAMSKRRQVQSVDGWNGSAEFRSDEWIDDEVVGCEFEDVRHGKRLRQLLEQLSGRVGATTPWACQDWANTKAAYRFFGNERISESNILAGHFACTRERFSASSGYPVLVLHDTTELSYRHHPWSGPREGSKDPLRSG